MNVSTLQDNSGAPSQKQIVSKFCHDNQEKENNNKFENSIFLKNEKIKISENGVKNETLQKQFEDLNKKYIKELEDSNYETSLEYATQLFAKARVLHEIYGKNEQFYYKAYLNLIKCYRKNEIYEMAEKHVIRVKLLIKKTIKDLCERQEEDQEMYILHMLVLKELFLIYSLQGIKDQASKLNDMLEEENLDILDFEDKLEYVIGKSEFFQQNGQIQEAYKLLIEQQEMFDQNIDSLQKINVAEYYQSLAEIYKQSNDFEQALSILQEIIKYLEKEDCSYRNIQCKIVDTYLQKIQIYQRVENCENELRDEYEKMAYIIFRFLQEPSIMITKENVFLNPLINYVNFLYEDQQIEKAEEVIEKIYKIVKLNYGIFHRNQIQIFQMKSKINLKLKEKKKAVNCLKVTIEICNQIGDKSLKSKLEKKLANILKNQLNYNEFYKQIRFF